MHKFIGFVVFMALLSPISAFASIDQNLKYGMQNTEVAELQDYLVSKGFLNVSPTGFFGLLTLNAVKAFQASVDLPNTGYVGVMTRTAINAELSDAMASSTAAEIAETGTTTPVVQTPTVIYQTVIQQVVPTSTPVLGGQSTSTSPVVEESQNCKIARAYLKGAQAADEEWKKLGETEYNERRRIARDVHPNHADISDLTARSNDLAMSYLPRSEAAVALHCQ